MAALPHEPLLGQACSCQTLWSRNKWRNCGVHTTPTVYKLQSLHHTASWSVSCILKIHVVALMYHWFIIDVSLTLYFYDVCVFGFISIRFYKYDKYEFCCRFWMLSVNWARLSSQGHGIRLPQPLGALRLFSLIPKATTFSRFEKHIHTTATLANYETLWHDESWIWYDDGDGDDDHDAWCMTVHEILVPTLLASCEALST